MRILLISGPIAVGKTSIAKELIESYSFCRISSGSYLSQLSIYSEQGGSREALQALGDKLDNDTDYRWLIEDVAAPLISAFPSTNLWLLDSVRKVRQVDHFKEKFGRAVYHVHFDAPENLLAARYQERISRGDEYVGNTPYEKALQHPNEQASRALAKVADLVLSVDGKAATEIARQVIKAIGG